MNILKLADFQHLIDANLVRVKDYAQLCVLKYNNKVFYDNLWNTDPLLNEARGLVFDKETGEVVIWPFTKVFNHHENGTELDLDTQVVAPRKINGFMAAARMHAGELLVSTTGTLDSDYVAIARKHIEALDLSRLQSGYTHLFEIVDASDPHIVEEQEGAWLIGIRQMRTGRMRSEGFLDAVAVLLEAKRPEVLRGTFREVLLMTQHCKHEGYMVIHAETGKTVMKLKSPHYLSKKFLMRMGKAKVDMMFESKEELLKTVDEEFYGIVHYITRWFTAEDWKQYDDKKRRSIIESYFDNLRGE